MLSRKIFRRYEIVLKQIVNVKYVYVYIIFYVVWVFGEGEKEEHVFFCQSGTRSSLQKN